MTALSSRTLHAFQHAHAAFSVATAHPRWAYEKARDGLFKHLTDSSAIFTSVSATIVPFELFGTFAFGNPLTPGQVIASRLQGATFTFLGAGRAIGVLRDSLREKYHINEASEAEQHRFDRRYTAAVQAGLTPPWYIVAGALSDDSVSPKTLFFSTLIMGAYGYLSGREVGLAIDTYRECVGMTPAGHVPEAICSSPRWMKAAIPVALTAGALFAVDAMLTARIAFDSLRDAPAHVYHAPEDLYALPDALAFTKTF